MPRKAVLVCNGSIDSKNLRMHLSSDDFIIAVDGGANKLLGIGFRPNLLVGDMDSISERARKEFSAVKSLVFPREKDFVDLEHAIQYCVEKNFSEVLILGAIGSRVDMSLTNVFLLLKFPEKMKAMIVHKNQEIFVIRKSATIEGIPGEIVSIFSIAGEARGLTLKGFKYELNDYLLQFGIGKGLSNELKEKKAVVSVSSGKLLCVHFKNYY